MVESNTTPVMPAGTAETTSSQAIEPSGGAPIRLRGTDVADALACEDDDVGAEVGDRPDQRADVEADVEGLGQRLVGAEVVPAEQPGHDRQVARRRDREELRQPLDDAEDDGVEDAARGAGLAAGEGHAGDEQRDATGAARLPFDVGADVADVEEQPLQRAGQRRLLDGLGPLAVADPEALDRHREVARHRVHARVEAAERRGEHAVVDAGEQRLEVALAGVDGEGTGRDRRAGC